MGLIETAIDVSNKRIEDDLKNRVQDILRSYRNFWDPFGELLQNSIDAINRRYRIYNDETFYMYDEFKDLDISTEEKQEYRGKILIEVYPNEKKLIIFDNGVGIKKEKIERIILPEGTDKKRGKEYGYKGKGLTYLAFISDEFDIKTKFFCDNKVNEFGLNGLFNWIIDIENVVEFPCLPVKDVTTIDDDLDGYNTRIQVKMKNDYLEKFSALSSLNKTFDLLKNKNLIDSFCILLRTKTAIGNTKYLFNKEPIVPIDIELSVYGVNDREIKKIIPYKYYHPKDHEEVSDMSYEFTKYVLEEKHKAGFLGKFKALNFAREDQIIGQRPPFISTDIHLTSISSTNLGWINENIGFVEDLSDAGFSYGVHLSIDGMPTGIRIDDWDTKGSSNKRYFAIVDANLDLSDELDSGRKGISYTRAKQISDKVLDLRYEKVKDAQNNFTGDKFLYYANKELLIGDPLVITGMIGENGSGDDFENRVNESLDDIKKDRNLNKEKLEYLQNNFSIQRFPRNEEEVRSLFHEMLAKNIIKGYKTIYDASTRADYDTALDYNIDLLEDNLEPEDPLGISKSHYNSLGRRGVKVLNYSNLYKPLKMNSIAICTEFKYSLNSFMYDISRASTSKCINKLDLLIIWDSNISNTYSEQYTIAPIYDNQRLLHGTTHRLNISEPEATNILCISLSEIIDKLMKNNKDI